MYKRIFLSLLVVGAVSACSTVGPDYAGPPMPDVFTNAGESVGDLSAQAWWTRLGDPVLDRLIERAFSGNYNLAVLRSRLHQARAMYGSERANQQPKGGATVLYAHAQLPSTGDGSGDSSALPSKLDFYNAGFDASWEIDLFGGRRRAMEAAAASAQAVEATLADAQVSLAAEVAQAYVNLRSCQRRLALNEAAVARQQHALELVQRRQQAGTATELDVARLQGQLESTRTDNQPLIAEQEVYRNALTMLLGRTPGSLYVELGRVTPVPLPPAVVNVDNPTALLRNRPDIRAAERTLAMRTAQIGQAEAVRFPRLTLMGLIGIGGTRASDLSHLDDFTALAAPQLSWNFLDFGRNAAGVDKANAARDEAEAQYQIAVLGALRDARDGLTRFRQQRIAVATRVRALALAERTANLTRERQHAGTATLIDVLDAERVHIGAEQSLALAEAALTNDFIALHKTLGLGWRYGENSMVR